MPRALLGYSLRNNFIFLRFVLSFGVARWVNSCDGWEVLWKAFSFYFILFPEKWTNEIKIIQTNRSKKIIHFQVDSTLPSIRQHNFTSTEQKKPNSNRKTNRENLFYQQTKRKFLRLHQQGVKSLSSAEKELETECLYFSPPSLSIH